MAEGGGFRSRCSIASGKFRRMRGSDRDRWRTPCVAGRARGPPRCRWRSADRPGSRSPRASRRISASVPASSRREAVENLRGADAQAAGVGHREIRPLLAKPVSSAAAVAGPGRGRAAQTACRSKLELTWMSMLGDNDGSTVRIDMSLDARKRARMSLRVDAQTSGRSAGPCGGRPRRPARCRSFRWGRRRRSPAPAPRVPGPTPRNTAPGRRCGPS